MKFREMLFLLLIVVLSSCSKNVEDVNETKDNSMFQISTLSVEGRQVFAKDRNWPDLKDQMVLSMKACLVDSIYSEKIIGSEFEIKSNVTSAVESKTMANSCLTWKEEVAFNYLEQEKVFVISGSLEGKGKLKGIQHYNVLINPWENKATALLDSKMLGSFKVNQKIGQKSSFSNGLYLGSVRYSVNEIEFSEHLTKIEFQLEYTPQLKRLGHDGSLIKEKFTQGVFSAEYSLVERDLDSGRLTVLGTVSSDYSSLISGKLSESVRFEIGKEIPEYSILEVMVKLKAEGAPRSFGMLTGKFTLSSLKEDSKQEFIEVDEQKTHAMLEKANDNVLPHTNSLGFVMNKINISRGEDYGTGGDSKSVVAEISICVVDSLVRESVGKHTFSVKLYDKDRNKLFDKNVPTEVGSGCMMIRPEIPYSDFMSRDWRTYNLELSSNSTPFKWVSKNRDIYINPWVTKGFGIDSKNGKPQVVGSNEPELFIKDMTYTQIKSVKDSFRVRQDLKVSFDLLYSLRIKPRIRIPQNFKQSKAYEDLPDTKLRLRGLVLSPKRAINHSAENIDFDSFSVVSTFSKEVEVIDGDIEEQIRLPLMLDDLTLFTGSNVLLLELSAIDEGMELKKTQTMRLFRSRVKSERSVLISNINDSSLQQKLDEKIERHQKRMASEGDNTQNKTAKDFVTYLNSLKEKVPVAEYKAYGTDWNHKQKLLHTEHVDNIDTLIRDKELELSRDTIEAMIRSPHTARVSDLKGLCQLFFDKGDLNAEIKARAMLAAASGPGIVPGPYIKTGYEPHPEYHKCKRNPESYLKLHSYKHIYDVDRVPVHVKIEPDKVDMSNAKFASKGEQFASIDGHREATYIHYEGHAGGGFEAGKGAFISGGVSMAKGKSFDTYVMNQSSDLISNLNRTIVATGTYFDVDIFTLELDIKARQCLLVSTHPHEVKKVLENNFFTPDKVATYNVQSNKRYYVCLDGINRIKSEESWYYLTLAGKGNLSVVHQDYGQIVSVIRGKRNYEAFKELEYKKNVHMLFVEDNNKSEDHKFDQYIDSINSKADRRIRHRYGEGFPGLID